MSLNIPEIPFGVPIQQAQIPIECADINDIEKAEAKQFDDLFYPSFRENNNFIMKDNLFQVITTDLMEFLKTVQSSNEIRVGYILYSKLSLNSSKMNNILNLLIQKINPNIRVLSMWDVQSSYKGPLQTANGIENVDFDKIRVKILIRPNDKDIAIKKLVEMSLNSLKKNNKKINEYLAKYVI
jgi:hypothetical protein